MRIVLNNDEKSVMEMVLLWKRFQAKIHSNYWWFFLADWPGSVIIIFGSYRDFPGHQRWRAGVCENTQ